jgi:hypothetical protein
MRDTRTHTGAAEETAKVGSGDAPTPAAEHAAERASEGTLRPVLLLGGGSDIALACARRFAARGHPIQLALRDPEAAEANRADLALRHGVPVTTHAYDALALERVEAFLDALPALPGIVICAVGLLGDQHETEGDPARIAQVIATNFTGPALMLEAAGRRLAALDEDTAIVGISSVAGDRGRARNYWYGAAKAGLTTALSGMRQRFASSRLLVVTVRPGFVATRMTAGMALPGALTDSADGLAALIEQAVTRHRPVVIPWKWRLVMGVIRAVPEPIFRRMTF